MTGISARFNTITWMNIHRQEEPDFSTPPKKTFPFEILRQKINQHLKVGCTGCGYCMPCPHGVDIPTAFRCYNQSATQKKFSAMQEYVQVTSLKKNSSAMTQCTKCGACERHCSQHIEIRKELQNAKKALQPFYIRAMLKVVGRLIKRKSV